MSGPAKRDHILIIEADEILQDLLAIHLKVEGFRVKAVGDSQSGLDILRENRTCIVILDLMMPGMDGLSLMRTLKAEIPAPPPVVVVSALKQEEVEQELLELGVAAILRKPADAEEILRHVHDALTSETYSTAT